MSEWTQFVNKFIYYIKLFWKYSIIQFLINLCLLSCWHIVQFQLILCSIHCIYVSVLFYKIRACRCKFYARIFYTETIKNVKTTLTLFHPKFLISQHFKFIALFWRPGTLVLSQYFRLLSAHSALFISLGSRKEFQLDKSGSIYLERIFLEVECSIFCLRIQIY